MAAPRLCSIPDCGKKHVGLGWCGAHYLRWRKHGSPTGGGPALSPPGAPLRWMREHLSHHGEGCLLWPFARHPNGYGAMRDDDGNQVDAHRWTCEQVNGPPPSSIHQAAHNCGRGRHGCVHPDHVRWATPTENMNDKHLHGTSSRGRKGYHSRLTEPQVRDILALKGIKSQSQIASMFDTTQTNVGMIHRKKTWFWLDAAS